MTENRGLNDLKKLQCPTCEEYLTDFAVQWSLAWIEGFEDCSKAFKTGYAKDGPIKTCCELCESRWEYRYFAGNLVEYNR